MYHRGAPGVLAVAGENIVDLIPVPDDPAGADRGPLYRAVPGGSPATIAVAARRLGSPVRLIARVSRDAFGDRIRARLRDNRIDGRHLVDATEPSSLAVVRFDSAHRAGYDFWLTGTADWQWRDDELPGQLDDDVTALHLGSLAAYREPGASALLRLAQRERQRGEVTISFDPNLRASVAGDLAAARERTEELVRLAHLVKASDEDLALLCPDADPRQTAAHWLTLGPSLVVVTLGAQGALAMTAGIRLTVPTPPTAVVDTVGAGDTFLGALLHGLDERGRLGRGLAGTALGEPELRELLGLATAAAALNCTRAGADPPTVAELAAAGTGTTTSLR